MTVAEILAAPATVRDAIFAQIEAALLPLVADGGVELEPSGDPDIFPSLSVFDGGHRFIEREAKPSVTSSASFSS